MEYKIRSSVIRWQISNIKSVVLRISALALTVSDISTFEMFDLDNLGQDHRVQHSQGCHSLANINANLHKSHSTPFYDSDRRFGDVMV